MGRKVLEPSFTEECKKAEKAKLEIRLLGSPGLYYAQRQLIIPRKRERALFYFLAAEDGRRAKSVLLRIFWGEQRDKGANHSLSNAIYRINRFIAEAVDLYPVLLVDSEGVYLDRDLFEIDLEFFEPWAESLDAHARKRVYNRDLLQGLVATVPLYLGEFLEGFYIENVDEFEEWVFFKRERYRRIYQKMLEVIVQQLSFVGEHEEALDYALKVLYQDPLSEEHHTMVMMLYWKLGDKGAVIRQYNSYRETIGERLGLEPPSEMRDLFYKMVGQFPNHAATPKDMGRMAAVPVEDELKGNLFERQGLTLFDISQYSAAFAEFKRALEYAEKTRNLRLSCRCLYHMGMAKLWGHYVEDAEYYLEAGYKLGKSIKDEQAVIGCAVNLALVYGLKGNLDESRRLSEEALKLKDSPLDSRSRYEVLMDASRRFLWKGNPKSAISGFKEALKLAQEKGRKADAILSHLFAGLAYGTEGNFGKALDNLFSGYDKAKEIGNTFLLSKHLNSIGWVYQELGDFATALPWDQAAANLARDNGWPEPLGYSLINLGLDHFNLGNLSRAQQTLGEAVEVAHGSTYQWRWLGSLWLVKAGIALSTGDVAGAMADIAKAGGLTGQVRGQKHSAKMDILNGKIHFASGDHPLAEEHFLNAVSTANYSGNPLTVVDACNAAAAFYITRINLESARMLVTRSSARIEEVAARLDGSLRQLFLNSPRVSLTRNLLCSLEKGGE